MAPSEVSSKMFCAMVQVGGWMFATRRWGEVRELIHLDESQVHPSSRVLTKELGTEEETGR